MDTSTFVEIVVIVFLIVLNAFFAASEIAIVSVHRARVKQLAEEGKHPAARTLLRLIENPARFLATGQVGITIASFFASPSAQSAWRPCSTDFLVACRWIS